MLCCVTLRTLWPFLWLDTLAPPTYCVPIYAKLECERADMNARMQRCARIVRHWLSEWEMYCTRWRWQNPVLRRLQPSLGHYRLELPASIPKANPAVSMTGLRSSLCRQCDFETPEFNSWSAEFNDPPRYHRKQWEFVFIAQALAERGFLQAGKRGLGFGVGREPLAAVFAKRGCSLLLTDMDPIAAQAGGWTDTYQHATQVTDLNVKGICDDAVFLQQARFQHVDMNHIPAAIRGFDFCWSACALEHLGSIEAGLTFIERSLDCLKPEGIAIHTTEYNLSSNTRTLDNKGTVLFRRCDLEDLQRRLADAGHTLEPLSLDQGNATLDDYLDLPPYQPSHHLRLALAAYACTSVGLIIRKGERAGTTVA